MSKAKEVKPPIKSGWRGNINGAIERTSGSNIKVGSIRLDLDPETAWDLANLLTDSALAECNAINKQQIDPLSNLGAALGRLIDHPAANNGGREVIK